MKRPGITLIELLVVIGIVGILIALMIPAVHAARGAAQATACKNKLRQLGVGVETFYSAHQRFPPGQFGGAYGAGPSSTAWNWLARILPQIEQSEIYKAGRIPTDKLSQSGFIDRTIDSLRCPSDKGLTDDPATDRGNFQGIQSGLTNYKAVCGANWGWDGSLGTHNIGTDWSNGGTNGSQDGQDHGDGIMYRSDSE